jgi:hypothetical protein
MPNLDLNIIPTHNIKTIGVADASTYETNLIITSPTLEITPPGFPKISIPFVARSVNIFNSNNLGISNCTNEDLLHILPDGIYKLKYSIQPSLSNYVEKSFFRVDALKCKYMKAFLSIDMDCSNCSANMKNSKKTISKVRLLIDGVLASANECDEVSAMKKYKQASKLLDSFKNCNC